MIVRAKLTEGKLSIRGTVNVSNFHRFKLEYAPGESQASDDIYHAHLITETFKPINGGELYLWDVATLLPGPYTLRLLVVQKNKADYFAPPCIVGFTLQ
jgi:hypothetical protein